MDTRPTLDRVKEALFGMLQFDIPGSRVLDLFSGSGNLGLEAASRGASYVLCNDHSRACAERISKNAALLGLDGIVSVACLDYADCIDRAKAEGRTFDFAFLDAPYADGTAAKAAEKLFSTGVIEKGGRVIIEHAANLPPVVAAELAAPLTTRKYGACAITVYMRAADERD